MRSNVHDRSVLLGQALSFAQVAGVVTALFGALLGHTLDTTERDPHLEHPLFGR